jgi:dihydrolipoamide dehydrogenase
VTPSTAQENMSKNFDVVVIGGGPGGYIAAIRAAQLGLNTACIDEWKNAKGGPAPGGTCTNVGCIPSKALLQSSENFDHAGHSFADHGISLSNLSIDVAKMLGRKDQVVKQNNDGILFLFKKNKVSFFHGRGSFVKAVEGGYEIAVAGDKPDSLIARHVIVATGSNPRALPGADFDEDKILSNDGALRIGAVPKTLGVIGSGVIGLEMGSVWRRLGAQVTVLEALPTFLGAVDEQIAKEAHKAFTKQGLKILLGVKIAETKTGKRASPCVMPTPRAASRRSNATSLSSPSGACPTPLA